MAEVAVVPGPVPGVFAVICTVHGALPVMRYGSTSAAWDAMGHAAAHHAGA